MKKWICGLLIFFSTIAAGKDLYTGFRGSRVSGFTADYLVGVADSMSRNFTSPGIPAAVWILSYYGNNGDIYVQFPNSTSVAHCYFTDQDYSESFLDAFDAADMKVWLQVEPGAANVETLIDLVFARYGHHSCIAGFGIDVEWLDTQSFSAGRQVTDAEAQAWEEKIQSYDTTYTLFLKHYTTNRMPPSYRGNLLLIDDSQGHETYQNFITNMKGWGTTFPNNPVGYQFGYAWDRSWWDDYPNPPATLGNGLLAKIPNTATLFWVDFTLNEVFHESRIVSEDGPLPSKLELFPNYPNPFNSSTTFRFSMDEPGYARLLLFDMSGRMSACVFERSLESGTYSFNWQATDLASGVYLAILQTRNATNRRYITLIK